MTDIPYSFINILVILVTGDNVLVSLFGIGSIAVSEFCDIRHILSTDCVILHIDIEW